MAVGLPVITSNFPLYQDVVEKYHAGICIDPYSADELANAIEYILTHKAEAMKMAENGKKTALEHYNWKIEEKKLLKLYKDLSS